MIEEFENKIDKYKENYITLLDLEQLKNEYQYICRSQHNKLFKRKYQNLDKLVEAWNQTYLQREETECKELLDNVKGYPLDVEQRQVVLRDEQNTLVIAGAGSGKSLTMIGKIRYLVERKKVPLDQILCISFTNDATKSLKDTIKKYYQYDLPVLTFHKLSIQIIQNSGKKVHIANPNTLEKVVENYLESIIFEEKDAQMWLCQHFFHNFKEKIKIFVNKMQSFPQIYEKIRKTTQWKRYLKIIPTFIHFMKANQNRLEELDHWIQQSKYCRIWNQEDTYLLLLMKRIYIHYQDFLNKNNEMDFDDLIAYATKLVPNDTTLKYQYILIDEYQDTSETRYKLVQAIIEKTGAKLIAVGDDFQSIYRFTGCDLNIFLKFKTYFPYSIILKIQTTYRNSQELIDVAGSFVMRNPRQMKKELVSGKRIEKPIIIQYYSNLLTNLKAILNQFDQEHVYLLGRNRKDIMPILEDDDFMSEDGRTIHYKNNPKLLITFFTVHTSKGLESDVVILLHMEDSMMGFPSKLEDDPILRYVNPAKDYYPYEEERRLFYVALTRTKSKVYVMVPKENPSIFIKELIQKNKRHIVLQKDEMI